MFPGKCERCGGPQLWTFDARGDTWVCCEDPGCVDDQLVLPSLDCEGPEQTPKMREMEHRERGRVVPLESGAVKVSETDGCDPLQDTPGESFK